MRRFVLLLIVLAALAGAWSWGGTWLLVGMARWLDVGEEPVRTEFVLVLGGNVNSRPVVAAELKNRGYSEKVLLTRTVLSPQEIEGTVPPQLEIATRVLERLGVPSDRIDVLPRDVVNTRDEAAAAREYLDQRPAARLAVVTSFPHTRRAKWVFQQVFGAESHRVSFVSAPVDGYGHQDWWRHERGFESILSEYLGIVIYALRYSLLWRAIAAGAVLSAIGIVCLCLIRRRTRRKAAAMSAESQTTAYCPWKWALVGCLLTLGWWFRHAILIAVASGLIANRTPHAPREATAISPACLVLRSDNDLTADGDRAFASAASLLAQREVATIMLVERNRSQAARVGAVGSFLELGEKDLTKRGVPEESIVAMTTYADDRAGDARVLAKWLAERPDERILLACDRFDSRALRWIIDRELDPHIASRIELLALPNRDYDETNWWRSYRGVKELVMAYIGLGHAAVVEGQIEN